MIPGPVTSLTVASDRRGGHPPQRTHRPDDGNEMSISVSVVRAVDAFCNAHFMTPREKTIISLVCRGLKNKCIATSIGLSEPTVRFHLRNIHRKSSTCDKVDLVLQIWRSQQEAHAPTTDPVELVSRSRKSASIQVHSNARPT